MIPEDDGSFCLLDCVLGPMTAVMLTVQPKGVIQLPDKTLNSAS